MVPLPFDGRIQNIRFTWMEFDDFMAFAGQREVDIHQLIARHLERQYREIEGGQTYVENLNEFRLFTRFIWASNFITVWALYENSLSSLAEYLRLRSQISLRLKDIQGDFLRRVKKYYSDVLHCQMHPIPTDWEKLGRLKILRNSFAHAGGSWDELPEAQQRKIEKFPEIGNGLEIVGATLIVRPELVQQSYVFLRNLVVEVLDRVETRILSERGDKN